MRKGEVCGACTGALMALSHKFSQSDAADTESKQIEFLKIFKKENGSYICNEFLGCDTKTPQVPFAVDNAYMCFYGR